MLVSDAGGPRENICPGQTGFVCSGHSTSPTGPSFAAPTSEADREAARQYALTRGWDSALAPLYRAYAETRTATTAEPLVARAEAVH